MSANHIPTAAAAPAAIHTPIAKVLTPLMLVLFISTLDQTIVATALGRIGDALGDAGHAPW